MSTEDRDEILGVVRSAKLWIKVLSFLVAIFGASISGVGFLAIKVAIDDHYDQTDLRKDSNWMLPKVSWLWYHNAEAQRSEN